MQWHLSRVRPLLVIIGSLCLAACASPEARMEKQRKEENSRVVEERRMRLLGSGAATSERAAELMVSDPEKSFDLARATTGSSRTYNTGGARVKDFYIVDKARPKTYGAKGYWGLEDSAEGSRSYSTGAARTRGKYEMVDVNRRVGDKSAPVKEAWDADKRVATRGLHDGKRQFLGKESERLHKPVDPAMLRDLRNQGQAVPGRPVELYSELKELTVEDVRELLNTNK